MTPRACIGCGHVWTAESTQCPRCPHVGEPLPDDHPEAIKARYKAQGDHNLKVHAMKCPHEFAMERSNGGYWCPACKTGF